MTSPAPETLEREKDKLYFDGQFHEYYHSSFKGWGDYPYFRPGEGFWLVPGTDPEDGDYDREYLAAEEVNEGDENDETLEYMIDLLDSGEIEPSEFRRQLISVGSHPDTISEAVSQVAA